MTLLRWIIAVTGGAVMVLLILLFVEYTLGTGNRERGPDPARVDITRAAPDEDDDAKNCCGPGEKVILRTENRPPIPDPHSCEPSYCLPLNFIPTPMEIRVTVREPRLVFAEAGEPPLPEPDEPTLSGNVTGARFCGRLIYDPRPRLPLRGRKTGELTAIFDVEIDGTVVNIRIRNATNSIWRREVIRALRQWRYEPYNPGTPDDECRPPFKDLSIIFEYRITEPE